MTQITLLILALFAVETSWSQTTPRFTRRHRVNSGVLRSHAVPQTISDSAQYLFQTIGVQDSPNVQGYAINDAGVLSGSYADDQSNAHGFVWQQDNFQTIDHTGAASTYLNALNSQGIAVGAYGTNGTSHAVTYSVPSGEWTDLPDIRGYSQNAAYGINSAGVVVGYASKGDTSIAWIWDPATSSYSFFNVPGAARHSTYPSGINDQATVVGSYVDTSGVTHGFSMQGKTVTTIDVPGAAGTFPYGINNSGTVVGSWFDAAGAMQGFILTGDGTFTTADFPGPLLTVIEGINNQGEIAGSYVEIPSGAMKAFIGRPGVPPPTFPPHTDYRIVSIAMPDDNGLAAAEAYGVNESGLVVGSYNYTSDGSGGFAWQDGTLQTLNNPDGQYTALSAVNNQGVAIGFYGDQTTAHAAAYSFSSQTWTVLPDISGKPLNEGNGINNLGVVVGIAGDGNDFNYPSESVSWIWDPGSQSYTFFEVPGSAQNSTIAAAINDSGQVTGIFQDANGVVHGYLKDGDTYTTIDVPGGTGTFPYGINNGGTIVGQWSNLSGWSEGFVRTSDGTFTVVNVPGGLESYIGAINGNGDICGSWVDPKTGVWTAFVGYK